MNVMAASGDALSLQGLLSEEEAKRAIEQIGDNWSKIKWVFDIASGRVTDAEVKLKQAMAKANSANINAGSFQKQKSSKFLSVSGFVLGVVHRYLFIQFFEVRFGACPAVVCVVFVLLDFILFRKKQQQQQQQQ